MEYDIYMALHEEANSGWVWFKTPNLPSRSLVRIRNLANGRTVECECCILDDRDVTYYNEETHGRRTILPSAYEDVAIMNTWYRSALDIKPAKKANLKIDPLKDHFWYALRAGCQHPDPIVRLATRLGVLGTWLGISGLLFALVSALSDECHSLLVKLNFVVGVLSVLAVIAWRACRGIKRGNP